ncbi:MAG: hypothetical protein IT356_10195 [Gemmatimonadaceae bacterium]|nr:hypothetical protein [Gemmatimonadaceae bacterium]
MTDSIALRLARPARAARVLRAGAALTLALLGVAACDATSPPRPASVDAAAASGIAGTVGIALTPAPQFVVRDARGNPLSGVEVTIVVTSGGGTLVGAPTRTSQGPTPVGTWTLGTRSGPNVLTVTVNGIPPLTITAAGTPDVPATLSVVTGDTQSAPAASVLPVSVAFRVADRYDNGVPGQVVSFAISDGGGLMSGSAVSTTDASGVAPAPAWTLGKSVGAQRMRATAGVLTATATATAASSYPLSVRFFGAQVDPAIQDAFMAAGRRIQGIVTGAVAPVALTAFDITGCGITGVAPLTEIVTGVIVYARVAPIDGPGKILGRAGPCYFRIAGGATIIGVMDFDVADLQLLVSTNRLNSVILHEMLHVLGFGTMWINKALITGAGTPSSSYTGAQGIAGCLFHGGGGNCAVSVPLETDGGSGTRDAHWREATTSTGIGFRNELMTGYVEAPGVPMPLSRMTIGALADLGYVVNQLPYDDYTVPGTAAAALLRIREGQGLGAMVLNEEVRQPIGAVDAGGNVYPPERIR